MSFDPSDYPSYSRLPLFRYGYGGGNGYQRPSFLADVLHGLMSGLQNYGAARQQAQQQDQQQQAQDTQNQIAQQNLQGLKLANQQTQQQMQDAPTNALYGELRQAYPGAAGDLANQQYGLKTHQIMLGAQNAPARVVTDQSQLPEDATSYGTEGNLPATITAPGAGIDFTGKDAQSTALRNILLRQMAGDAGQYEKPGAILGGLSQYADPTKPFNPPDIQALYNQGGRTKVQVQQDALDARQTQKEAAAAALQQQKDQARQDLTTLQNAPKMARTEAEFIAKVGRAYDQAGGSPEYRDAFLNTQRANWRNAPAVAAPQPEALNPNTLSPGEEEAAGRAATPAPSPGATTTAGPSTAQMFPNGTTAQAGIALKGAQGAATTQNAATRAAAQQDTASYRQGILAARQTDQNIRQQLGQQRISVQQAALGWRQSMDQYKAAMNQWTQDNAAALKGPKADPVLTQRATLLRQRIGRLENQINNLQRGGNDQAAKNLYPNLDNLNREFDGLISSSQQPVAPLTPRPTLATPSSGGIPALPVPPGGVNMNTPAAPSNAVAQQALQANIAQFQRVNRRPPTPAEINEIARRVHGAIGQ